MTAKSQKFVNSLMKKDNVKAHDMLEKILKQKCMEKIQKTLKAQE